MLTELLKSAAARFPDKAAVLQGSTSVSFSELDRSSDHIAHLLRAKGIERGDHVVILSENSIPGIAFFWGVLKTGATVVDLPHLAPSETLVEILDECKPGAACLSRRMLDQLEGTSVERRLPAVRLSDDDAQAHVPAPRTPAPADADEDDVAIVLYTSGTTGKPKGVMLTHRNLASNIQASNELQGLTHEDSLLLVVPLHFVHGRMQLLMHTMIGGSIALSEGFQFPKRVLQEIVAFGVSGLSGVPYHFNALLKRSSLRDTLTPDLRYVLITGGALSAEATAQLREALPDVKVHLAYGQTEASPRITYLGPDELTSRPGSVGRALPGVEVEILDEDGAPLPAGQVGEVVAKGPNIMRGYFASEELTAEVLDSEGRLHTGDWGRLDADGYLFLAGRKSQMIKTAGERVFPGEIEDVIGSHPDVRECVVFGIPDPLLGERLVAQVVAACSDLDEQSVRGHCLEHLSYVRTPREIQLVDALPKTASAKIDRGRVVQNYMESLEAKSRGSST